MKRPTFSVIVPTYNRANLVRRTLESVLSQRYPAHEVIVVDNASTDGTHEVLRPLVAESRIVFIRHERNLERAASRNTGMSRATGDYVTFLDSDDLMYPDNLADAATFAERYPHAKLFHNLYEHVRLDGSLVNRGRFPSIKDPIHAIADGNFMSCIGCFVHRDLYKNLSFDDGLVGSEDWEFWMRAIARAGLGRIAKFNSAMLAHEERSVLHDALSTAAARLNRLQAKLANDPELRATYGRHLSQIRASSFLFLASAANSANRRTDAIAYLIKAIRTEPAAIKRSVVPRIAVKAIIGPRLVASRS